MNDRFKFTVIAHANRDILGPYSAEALKNLLPETCGSVLDIGCGKGAALAALGGQGVGLEINPSFAVQARQANPQAEIWEGDAQELFEKVPEPAVVLCLGASQALGEPKEAMRVIAEKLPDGGVLLFGDGYWRQKPPSGYLEFLDCAESDMPYLEDLRTRGEPFGLTFEGAYESTFEDWSAYEDSYYQAVIEWCDANPNDTDADGFRARIEAWRSAYLKWGRETLGFAIVLYRKTG